MAGGKQPPRQAMINMMYLVLTALLALQVSNDVLNKFRFIDDALKHSIKISEDANGRLVEGIEEKIKETGNRGEDLKVLSNAQEARKVSLEARTKIEEVRQVIVDAAGGFDHGELKDAKSYDAQMALTIGEGDGVGYDLEKVLNDFVSKMNTITEDSLEIDKIAKSGLELYGSESEQSSKDFAHITFDHTPNIAVMAVLSQLESEVVRVETEAVEFFAKKVGASRIQFDEVLAMVRPDSKVVPAGTEYRADLFITARANNINPKMSSSVGAVKVDPGTKMGEIKFKANATKADYDPKTFLAEKKYKASITIPKPTGGDTTLSVEETYFVAKPVVQVQSASVQALYLNCGNNLDVTIPAFGEDYNPVFSSSTGEVIKGAKKGNVTVVPDVRKVLNNNKKAALTVSSTGYSETLTFSVRKIPDPDVDVFKGSKRLNPKNPTRCGGAIEAKAVPDTDFAAFLPKDARYRVTKVELILKRGSRAVQTKTLSSGKINLNSFCRNFKSGDQLVVTIEQVKRMNFKGETELVKLPQKIGIYPLN